MNKTNLLNRHIFISGIPCLTTGSNSAAQGAKAVAA